MDVRVGPERRLSTEELMLFCLFVFVFIFLKGFLYYIKKPQNKKGISRHILEVLTESLHPQPGKAP